MHLNTSTYIKSNKFEYIALQIIILLTFILLNKACLFFTFQLRDASIFCPATGFALAVLLHKGIRYLPMFFFGALFSKLLSADDINLSTFIIPLGNILEYGLLFFSLNKLNFFNQKFNTVKDYFAIVICAILISPVNGLLGPTSLWLSGIIQQDELNRFMLHWWVGDVLGIIFVSPFLLFFTQPTSFFPKERLNEIIGLFIFIIILVFLIPLSINSNLLTFSNYYFPPIWITPAVIWAALRTNPKTTAFLQLFILIMMLISASFDIGYFAQDIGINGIENFWLFALMISIVGQAIAMNESERQNLLKRLQLTQSIMDKAPVEVYWVKPNGQIVYANDQATNGLGYSNKELLQMKIPDINPDYPQEQWPQHWNKLQSMQVLRFETKHRCKNQTIRPVKITANYVQFEGLEYNVAFVRDITVQKKAEQSLYASEKRFRDLFDYSPDPCWLINENNYLIARNLAAKKLINSNNDNPQELQSLFTYLQLDASSNEALIALVFEKGVHRFQSQLILSESISFPVEVTLTKITIDNENLMYCVLRDISDHQQAISTLEKQHRQLIKTEELAHLGSWEFDHATHNLTWSNEAYRIFGWEHNSHPTYESFLEAVHPNDRKKVDESFKRSIINKQDGYSIEHRIIHQSTGEIRFVLEKSEHVLDREGAISISAGMVQDITDQKKLRLESDRLAHSIAASNNEIFLFDAKTFKFIFVNDRAKEHLGYSHAEILNLRATDIKPDFSPEQFNEHLLPLLKHEKNALSYKILHQTKDGEQYPVSIHLQLFEPKDDLAYFLSIAVDLTEQEQLETKLTTVYESINAVIWSTDDLLNFEHVSRRVERMLGYSANSFLNTPLIDTLKSDFFHSNDRKLLLNAFGNLLGFGKPIKNMQHRIKTAWGEWKWVSTSISPIYNNKKQLIHIVGVITDISTQKEAEASLLQINAELDNRIQTALAESRQKDILLQQQNRLAGMGEMVVNIAHQWRQPLNALSLILMDFEDRYLCDEVDNNDVNQMVARCSDLLEKMSNTIDDFRNFFKHDKVLSLMDMNTAVNEVVSILEASLQYHNISLTVNKPTEPVNAWCYPGELSQALSCLISNAKDQISELQIHQGKIEINIETIDGWAVIHVSDNGGGIDEKVSPLIFDPYFTTKSKGSGIGLYISKLTIEKSMQGKLKFENMGEGACFSVFLPKNKENNNV